MATVQIGGNTYDCREYIKSAGGKWQAASKTWAMDSSKWESLKTSKPALMRGCRVVGGVADSKLFAAPRKIGPVNGPCRICGTYCYGDCQA